MPAARRRAAPIPTLPPHLEAALGVIEAVQSLGELVDVAEILATLARRLTELVDASACLVSLVDMRAGSVRDRAGYARPPHEWPRAAEEYLLADYPRTAAVIETGQPYGCSLGIGRPDLSESARLRDLGYRSLLMLRLCVDGAPYGLIEIYDEHRRTFAQTEMRLCQALATEAGKAVSRARMAERLEEAYFSTLGALAAALEAKDAYTSDHAMHIAELAGAVCERLDFPPGESRLVRLAALLHDIGKIGVPEVILRKPGPLTARETAKMRQHAEIGARILKPVPHFAELVPIVRASHERWDGTGYPEGLAAEDIPLGARVICVCDAFHAMTEDRVYRRALPVADAMAEIERCSGSQFDPECAEALLDVVRAQGWPRIARDRVVRLAHGPT